MSLASLYNKKINIIRVTKSVSPGGLGGFGETDVTLHLNLPCRINWKRGSEKIFIDKSSYFRDGKIYCSVVDINVKDKVQYNGVIYEIVDVNNTDEVGMFLVLDVKLIQ